MGIKYGRGWGVARISLSRGSVLSTEYFPSSISNAFWKCEEVSILCHIRYPNQSGTGTLRYVEQQQPPFYGHYTRRPALAGTTTVCLWQL